MDLTASQRERERENGGRWEGERLRQSQKDRQTDKQTGRQAGRQAGRQTDRLLLPS